MTTLDLEPSPGTNGTGGRPPEPQAEPRFSRSALVLGVDIGNSGGLALVTSAGELVRLAPMPILHDGPKGRPTVNAPLLAALVERWAPASAFVELVGPRPGEAAGGAFSFGRARGLIEGTLAAQRVPTRMVTPATWKRAVGIPAGREGAKDLARAEAVRR